MRRKEGLLGLWWPQRPKLNNSAVSVPPQGQERVEQWQETHTNQEIREALRSAGVTMGIPGVLGLEGQRRQSRSGDWRLRGREGGRKQHVGCSWTSQKAEASLEVSRSQDSLWLGGRSSWCLPGHSLTWKGPLQLPLHTDLLFCPLQPQPKAWHVVGTK